MSKTVTPVRIQRKRTKGWRMQEESRATNGLDAVYVGRPTKWGNPWPDRMMNALYPHVDVVQRYLQWLQYELACYHHKRAAILGHLSELRGHNLCCWCDLSDDCHADVLLKLANKEETK